MIEALIYSIQRNKINSGNFIKTKSLLYFNYVMKNHYNISISGYEAVVYK